MLLNYAGPHFSHLVNGDVSLPSCTGVGGWVLYGVWTWTLYHPQPHGETHPQGCQNLVLESGLMFFEKNHIILFQAWDYFLASFLHPGSLASVHLTNALC